jgi:hypothetical protein
MQITGSRKSIVLFMTTEFLIQEGLPYSKMSSYIFAHTDSFVSFYAKIFNPSVIYSLFMMLGRDLN